MPRQTQDSDLQAGQGRLPVLRRVGDWHGDSGSDYRRGQTVQPAVMATSKPISAVLGRNILVHYLTVSGWSPR